MTYPQRAVIVKGIQQLDDVAVITFSQDVDLDHVVLQLLFGFCLDLFGGSENASLLVPGLRWREKGSIEMIQITFRIVFLFIINWMEKDKTGELVDKSKHLSQPPMLNSPVQ